MDNLYVDLEAMIRVRPLSEVLKLAALQADAREQPMVRAKKSDSKTIPAVRRAK